MRTAQNDPLQKYAYRVSIPGFPVGMGFSKVGGLKRSFAVAEYSEGGYKYTHKLPGKEKFDDVVLERGAYSTTELEDLYKKTLSNKDFRQTIVIEHLDKNEEVMKTYKLAEAWVSSWEGSDLDALSSDAEIDKITISYEYMLE